MPGRKSSSFSSLSIPVNKSIYNNRAQTHMKPSHDHANLNMKMLNEAALRSARNLSVATNKAASNYYSFTFIDDENDSFEEDLQLNRAEETLNATSIEEKSINNSKFAFEDDEAWLGSRRTPKLDEDILNNNKPVGKSSSHVHSEASSHKNVVEVLVSQSEQTSQR